MTKEHPTVEELRAAITAADEIVIRALAARFRAIERLKELKKENGMPVEDAARETKVKEYWKKSAAEHDVPESLALLLLDFILSESKRLQSL